MKLFLSRQKPQASGNSQCTGMIYGFGTVSSRVVIKKQSWYGVTMKEDMTKKFVLLPLVTLVLLVDNYQAAQAEETYYYYPAESSEEQNFSANLTDNDIVHTPLTRSLKTVEEVNSAEGEVALDKDVNLASSEGEPLDEAKELLLENLLLEGIQLEIFQSTQNQTTQLITKNIRELMDKRTERLKWVQHSPKMYLNVLKGPKIS